jgi:hypothetical protein
MIPVKRKTSKSQISRKQFLKSTLSGAVLLPLMTKFGLTAEKQSPDTVTFQNMMPEAGKNVRVLSESVRAAWDVSWEMFFRDKTNLFYDWLSSYDRATCLAHLPTVEEISRQYPNPNGWGTGMEDSMINAGVMLPMVCDRYETTREDMLAEYAAKIFSGMVSCGRVHGVKGFVARSICLEDAHSVYIDSSRDQYTHYVHGLWYFYRSPLSTPAQRDTIREMIKWICEYSERCITPENNFKFNRADGTPAISTMKMWDVAPHEAARLPMIYAAGWNITGDAHWKELYRKYARDAAEQSCAIGLLDSCYPLLQMQTSLELLYDVEKEDQSLKELYKAIMERVAEIVMYHAWKSNRTRMKCDTGILCRDWRKRGEKGWHVTDGYKVPKFDDDFLRQFLCVREQFESPLAQMLCPGRSLSANQLALLLNAIRQTDARHHAAYGIFYLQAAYWKAVRLGYLKHG